METGPKYNKGNINIVSVAHPKSKKCSIEHKSVVGTREADVVHQGWAYMEMASISVCSKTSGQMNLITFYFTVGW